MDPSNSNAQGATLPAGAAPTDVGNAQPAAVPDGTAPASEEWRNPEEIKKMIKQTRENAKLLETLTPLVTSLQKALGKTETPAPVKAQDTVATPGDDLAGKLALRDAMTDLSVKLDRDSRELIDRLWKAEKPTDVGSWLDKTVKQLKLGAQPASAAAPVVEQAKPASNTGAPGAVKAPANSLQGVDGATFTHLSVEEQRSMIEGFLGSEGTRNPMRRRK